MKKYLKISIATLLLSLSYFAGAVNQFSYELTSYNHSGYCSTGQRTFSDFGRFCMGLQSSKLNNHCAETARHQLFVKQGCFEQGFRFLESVECQLSFYEKSSDSRFEAFSTVEHPFYTTRACIGRNKFGRVISNERLDYTPVKPGLFIDMNLSFINAFDSYSESKANVKIYAFERDADGTDVGIPIMVEVGSHLERSIFSDSLNSADYTLNCRQVAFCAD